MRRSSSRNSRGAGKSRAGRSETASYGNAGNEVRLSDGHGGQYGRLPGRQFPFAHQIVPQTLDLVHVAAPFPQERREASLDFMDLANHASFEMVRFAASVHEIQEREAAAAEGDMLSGPNLDASDVPCAERMERVVHEILDRGEHRGDEVGVFVRMEPGQVDEGRAARVGQVQVLDDAVERMRKPGHGRGWACPD